MLNTHPSLPLPERDLSSPFRLMTAASDVLARAGAGGRGPALEAPPAPREACLPSLSHGEQLSCPRPTRGPTFLAALALVAGVADAGAHDAGAVVAAGHVDALVGGHVALGALPAAVAQAPALHVLPIPAAEHGAGGCGDSAGESGVDVHPGIPCRSPPPPGFKRFPIISMCVHLSALLALFHSS